MSPISKRLIVLAVVGLAGPAFAQEPPPRTRGTVVSASGDSAMLRTANGEVKVDLAGAGYVGARRGSLADVTQGGFIGAAAVPGPDGRLRAIEVAVFADSMRGAGEGSYPWDLGTSGSMTNGTVASVEGASSMTNGTVQALHHKGGLRMTVTYKGGQQVVAVGPHTPVVTLEPGTRAMLISGAHVVVFGASDAGVVQAKRIIVGENGTVPPM
jgi:hypothetical protein